MNEAVKLWEGYREEVYKEQMPLAKEQERECSLAFYAGMMGSMALMAEISDEAKDEEAGALELEILRQQIVSASRHANLDRSDGKS